jgi:hypothetical protein
MIKRKKFETESSNPNNSDQLKEISLKRNHGQFYTKINVSEETFALMDQLINPTFIIEPYVGNASLIRTAILTKNAVHGIGNDIDQQTIFQLQDEFKEYAWQFTNLNTILIPVQELISLWKIPQDPLERVVFFTNPPFGTSSTNKLASKKEELKKGTRSRQIEISYGGMEKLYGKGDIVIPAIGKIIELIKALGQGYLAFFSPSGLFLGRTRYNKILTALLTNFKFLEGCIYPGNFFEGVNKEKAIAFTIWQYQPGINTNHDTLSFIFRDQRIPLKKCDLLKGGWRYRDGSRYVKNRHENPLGVFRCDRFNCPNPKVFSINLKDGSGAEISPDNVKKPLNIGNLSDELIYSLWSTAVGYYSMTSFPVYINEAYVHLPDFKLNEVQKILAYIALYDIIDELNKHYCDGQIGFDKKQQFHFGDKNLTKEVIWLINNFREEKIGSETIEAIFSKLPNPDFLSEFTPEWRKQIKKEIETLLDQIGYWDVIPIPN